MNATAKRVLAATAALLALAVAGGWALAARSQINAAPSWVPIGVAASAGGSTAWFHDVSSRRVLVCQASGASASLAVHCASAVMP